MARPTSSLDDVRDLYPHLGLAVYAMEPRGPVTLEIYTPGGDVFSFPAATEADAIRLAFPLEEEVAPLPQTEPIDIFE